MRVIELVADITPRDEDDVPSGFRVLLVWAGDAANDNHVPRASDTSGEPKEGT